MDFCIEERIRRKIVEDSVIKVMGTTRKRIIGVDDPVMFVMNESVKVSKEGKNESNVAYQSVF
jgi:hypothetical protein